MKRSAPWLLLVILIVLCFCLVCIVAILAVFRPEWLPFGLPGISRDQIILRVPDRRQEADYYLVRPGQDVQRGLLLADDTQEASPTLWGQQTANGFAYRPFGFGAFLPESRSLLYLVQAEGGTSLNLQGRRGGEPRQVHETDARITSLLTLDSGDTIFIVEEHEPGRVRCYVSRRGDEAQRVARGDTCQVSSNGSTLLVSDAAADALTLTAYNLDGADSEVLLDEQEGTDGTFRLSADGTRVAYVSSDGERSNVVVISRQDGRVLAEGDEFFRIVSYEFSPQGSALFVIGETDEGNLALSLLEAQSRSIASGEALDASFSPDGQYLIVLSADEAGDEALLVHPVDGGEDVAVLDRGDLSFGVVEDPDVLLIAQTLEGETILYRAGPSGAGLEELVSSNRVRGLEVFNLLDDPRFFALLSDSEARQTLYVGPTGEIPGFELLEDWVSLTPLDLSPDGRWLAFVGQEDARDDPVLYAIRLVDGETPLELDDDHEGIQNALFSEDGDELFYTAITGSDADEVEVRSVRTRGDRPYEALYSQAALEAASWDALDPFGSSILSLRSGLATPSLCPGATTIAAGDEIEDTLERGGRNCYRFRAGEALDYSVGVIGEFELDSRMEVYARDGTLIAGDDDSGPGLSPRLALTLDEGGLYYIYVFGFSDSDAGAYSLTVTEGRPGTVQEEAVLLPFDETVRGAITAESEVFIEEFDTSLFAAVYHFEAQFEDWIVVDLSAGSIGSSLDPMMALLDDNFQTLTFAEPMEGGTQFAYSIPSTGRYYLLVLSSDEGYGSAEDYFFDITLTLGTPPGTVQEEAVLLPLDETVRGAITAESEVLVEAFDDVLFAAVYYFEAQFEDWIVVDLSAGSIGSPLYPTMVLLDDNAQTLTYAEPDMEGDLQLAYSIPSAGRYYLLILSGDQGYGSAEDYFFDVTLTLGTPPEPGGGPIDIGETVEGNLQATIHDEWTFTAEAGETVTISMTSSVFDTYLELYDPASVSIAYDDDSGGDLNSLIRNLRLSSAGTYTIRARSYSGRSSGPYTLSLTAGAPDTGAGGSISPGETVEGDLQRGDQDEWTFEARSGQVVTIVMWSDEIDPYLILLDPNGIELTRDDDGAGYPNAMINAFELPDTGTYTIIARSFGDSRAGAYTLVLMGLVE